MIEVAKNIYVGNESYCSFSPSEGLAIIHACKHPCHRKALNYRNSLPSSHPNYLIYERGKHLVLNTVDMEQELMPKYTNPIMSAAIQFIEKYKSDYKILIHCNQGQSRSPSIALVYLAKENIVNNNSYQDATENFLKIYQWYQPGTGIAAYLNRNWEFLMDL